MGVMDEIRGHLSDGKASREIIQLGYAPGSVYRLQREFRAEQAEEDAVSKETEQESPVPGDELQSPAPETLQSEESHDREQTAQRRAEVAQLANAQAAIGELREGLNRLSDQTQRLDGKVYQQLRQQHEHNEALKRRIDALTEITKVIGLLLLHLDVHHRQAHGWSADPADGDTAVSDEGYRKLVNRLRPALNEAFKDLDQRREYGLRVSFAELLTENVSRHLTETPHQANIQLLKTDP